MAEPMFGVPVNLWDYGKYVLHNVKWEIQDGGLQIVTIVDALVWASQFSTPG